MADEIDAKVDKRSELIGVAEAMIDGTLDLIAGARRICSLRFEAGDPDNEAFIPIRGFESETEIFPLGKVRDMYAAEYLQRLDEDADRYISEAEGAVLDACREIIGTFSPGDSKCLG